MRCRQNLARILLSALVFDWIVLSALAAAFPVIEERRTEITLYSWVNGDTYRFALVHVKDRSTFLAHFVANQTGLSITGLDRELMRVPRKEYVIAWRDDKTRALTFPSENIVRKIRRLAAGKKLDLQIIPSIYD